MSKVLAIKAVSVEETVCKMERMKKLGGSEVREFQQLGNERATVGRLRARASRWANVEWKRSANAQ